jgi:hypothetical protein
LGGRALGLLDCGIFQETLEFALDTSPLGGGMAPALFGVISLLQLGSGWPCEGRGQPCPGVVNNTALDVPGSMTRSSGECSACPLLLEVLSELHKLPCFFVELGLHLAELLKLRALTPPPHRGPGLS